ncbi:MAG: zf-HC2 domain-containing protein [Fimbriimonadaceae bacterium]|jgi:anti-sigma factor RsiW|nr:zf-HC2 domain-containing protein [Fimbriimonadaceae bacterium]
MACDQLAELLSAYVDGELSAAETKIVHRHLATCDDCLSEVEELTQLKLDVSSVRFEEPDEAVLARLEKAVFSAPQKERETRTRWGLVAAVSVVATLCAFAAFQAISRQTTQAEKSEQIASDEIYVTGDSAIGAALPLPASFSR